MKTRIGGRTWMIGGPLLTAGAFAEVGSWWRARRQMPGPDYSRIADGLFKGGCVGTLPEGTAAALNLSTTDDGVRAVALTNASGTIMEAYDTGTYGHTICFSAAGTGEN